MSDEREPDFRVDVYRLRSGQPRAYADSWYEANLVFSNRWKTNKGTWKTGTWCPDEKAVREFARLLVRPFVDEPAWHDARLESIEKTAPDTWNVVIKEPYLD